MEKMTIGEFPVGSMEELESIGPRMKWQYFERLVAFVFESNGYDIYVNVVKRFGGAKRQYDVIAEGPRHIIAADCKRWTGRRYKASMLRNAADRQIERCLCLKSGSAKGIIPLIVTLMSEDIVIHQGVPIVPIEKLNAFINSWEENDDGIRHV
jgi:hypothetical protein